MDIIITALAIVVFMLLLKYITQKRSQKSLGKQIDISLFDEEIKDLMNGRKSVLYFYTPTCGVCKSQAPIIEKLKDNINVVGKIDLSQHNPVSKEFGILGVPTTAIMKGNTVIDIFVGLKKYDFLKSKFEAV
jgi:thioredoxin-like negative regulator of GroEL